MWVHVLIAAVVGTACLALGLSVADGFYRSRYPRWKKRVAQIGGRRGVIVSHWPLDVRITINAPMTDEERLDAFNRSSGWTWGEYCALGERRIWITAWQWNAVIENDF